VSSILCKLHSQSVKQSGYSMARARAPSSVTTTTWRASTRPSVPKTGRWQSRLSWGWEVSARPNWRCSTPAATLPTTPAASAGSTCAGVPYLQRSPLFSRRPWNGRCRSKARERRTAVGSTAGAVVLEKLGIRGTGAGGARRRAGSDRPARGAANTGAIQRAADDAGAAAGRELCGDPPGRAGAGGSTRAAAGGDLPEKPAAKTSNSEPSIASRMMW